MTMSNLVNSDNTVVRYLRETRAEIAKVSWPSVEQTRNLSLIVLGVTVAMSVALGVLDSFFAFLVQTILKLVGQ